MSRGWICRLAAVCVWSFSCEGSSGVDPGGPDAAAPAIDAAGTVPADPALIPGPQTPPMGQTDLEPWLAALHYQGWSCEVGVFPVRLNGAHGRHRICSNQLLKGSTSGSYPVGAASVKELFDSGDKANGWAVGLKVRPGTGHDTWYWYERTGRLATLRPVADGVGAMNCGPSCHAQAPRDNVFITAP
jgi:hypothetical protein